jgi:ATP-dependent protease ClpP protease subunit
MSKHFEICGGIDEDLLRRFYKFTKNLTDKDTATITISSHGGDPDVALAIFGIIQARPSIKWHTIVYGYAYSAAVLLFAAGTKRTFSKYAFAMVHETREKVKGESSSIMRYAKHMERSEQHWNRILEQQTGTPLSIWEKLAEKTTYINAEDSLKLGLATEVL